MTVRAARSSDSEANGMWARSDSARSAWISSEITSRSLRSASSPSADSSARSSIRPVGLWGFTSRRTFASWAAAAAASKSKAQLASPGTACTGTRRRPISSRAPTKLGYEGVSNSTPSPGELASSIRTRTAWTVSDKTRSCPGAGSQRYLAAIRAAHFSSRRATSLPAEYPRSPPSARRTRASTTGRGAGKSMSATQLGSTPSSTAAHFTPGRERSHCSSRSSKPSAPGEESKATAVW